MKLLSWRAMLLCASALTAVLLAGVAHAATAGKEVRITVLMSHNAGPYEEALAGFRRRIEQQGLRASLDVARLDGDGTKAAGALKRAQDAKSDLLFTIGSIATEAAVRGAGNVPIIAGLVLKQGDLRGNPNATGVVLEFPVEVEFRWLQRFLPGQKNIGVLFNPTENQGRIDAAVRVARDMGLTLLARSVLSPKEIPDALDGVTNRAGVLWGLADQVVLTPETAKPILLFSFRNRIPFIGLSLPWVKAGALYALDRDYADIGAQCGEMALKILQGSAPAALPPAAPRKVVYSINLKTARYMKLDIPDDLLHGAREVVDQAP